MKWCYLRTFISLPIQKTFCFWFVSVEWFFFSMRKRNERKKPKRLTIFELDTANMRPHRLKTLPTSFTFKLTVHWSIEKMVFQYTRKIKSVLILFSYKCNDSLMMNYQLLKNKFQFIFLDKKRLKVIWNNFSRYYDQE